MCVKVFRKKSLRLEHPETNLVCDKIIGEKIGYLLIVLGRLDNYVEVSCGIYFIILIRINLICKIEIRIILEQKYNYLKTSSTLWLL